MLTGVLSHDVLKYNYEYKVGDGIMAFSPREEELINDLRNMLSDDDPDKNILNGKNRQYSDSKLLFFLKQAVKDLNTGSPRTSFTLENFPDTTLLVQGAMIFSFLAEGVLQLRNQVSYTGTGLQIGMFNKSSEYQAFAGFLLQTYIGSKLEFKRSVIANRSGSGFFGVRSSFHTDYGRW